jgi:hypothetical protein
MPCLYDGPLDSSSNNGELKRELDLVTRLLCNAVKILRYQDARMQCPGIKKEEMKELQEWIKNHDKLDEKRQLEEVRKNALAKLSEEERKALGL